jgi:hypothetical protein
MVARLGFIAGLRPRGHALADVPNRHGLGLDGGTLHRVVDEW